MTRGTNGSRLAIVVVMLGLAAPRAWAADPIMFQSPFAVPTLDMIPLSISGMAGEHLLRATISGPAAVNFQFVGACEDPRDCTFTTEHPLPTYLDVTCANGGSTLLTAMLMVTSETSSFTGVLTCAPTMATVDPHISVSPAMLAFADTAVGATSAPMALLVANSGTGAEALTFQLALGAADFVADACVAMPCAVSSGGSLLVPIRFLPSAVGDRSTTLQVASNDLTSMGIVIPLHGTGIGASLEVDTPPAPDYTLEFGTIGRHQSVQLPVKLRNTGNTPIAVTLTPPPGPTPFALSTTTLALAPGPGTFAVTCASATAGDFSGTIGLDSDAIAQATDSITALCTVAPTDVQVTPDPLDFGEVRLGSVGLPQVVTITNPSAVDVPLSGLHLVMAPAGLALIAPPPQLIPAGMAVTAMVTLATDHDVVLDGASLVIAVDGTELVRPITGRVVTAAAHVEPGMLDLGTVCVGRQVSGAVRLVNDGTATLVAQAPTVMGAFTAMTQGGPFPADLSARESISTTITPSLTTPGVQAGTLAWDVDAPNGPFQVGLGVEYISTGTAVSPRGLAFEATPIHTIAPSRVITLENCSPDPTELEVQQVVASQGRAAAWLVEARGQTRTLAPGERFAIAVGFAPDEPGSYTATLRLVIAGTENHIPLTGLATGDPIDKTSFYACNCSTGSGSPTGAWPIPLALLLAASRRRRSR